METDKEPENQEQAKLQTTEFQEESEKCNMYQELGKWPKEAL